MTARVDALHGATGNGSPGWLADRHVGGAVSNAVLGTALYISTAVMLFGGLISAALVLRAGTAAWPASDPERLPVALTGANLLVLLASGGLVWWAQRTPVRGGRRRALNAGAGLGAVFLTEKAAAELKERIYDRCREELGAINGLAEMYVGTIHGFCLDLLKTEVPKYLKFEVLNEVQQVLFVDRNSKGSGLTVSTDLRGNALRRYTDTGYYISALSILREAALNPKALKGCSVVKGMESYRNLLEEKSLLDYSAILDQAVGILMTDKDLRKRLAERIEHVIVDEYQDVNPIQEAVVEALQDLGPSRCCR